MSLVLNNRSGVSDSTRACVEELLLSHGYAVRGKEDIRYDKRNILFIRFRGSGHLFEAVDDFYERIFDGADASAKLLGYTITVTNINLEGLPQLLKDAELQNTDGIIFFASEFEPVHAEMLTETSLPLVVDGFTAVGTANPIRSQWKVCAASIRHSSICMIWGIAELDF